VTAPAVPSGTTADPLADAAERFAKDVASHEMTVLHDDGLYRHIRFRSGRSAYWFELVTWPGSLTVNGGMEAFTFSRCDDMFEFFRGKEINPSYWAEKVRGRTSVKGYSEEKFRQIITGHIAEGAETYPSLAQEWPGLAEAVQRDLFAGAIYYEHGAREALDEFAFGDRFEAECRCGEKAEFPDYETAASWPRGHAPGDGGHWAKCVRTTEGFRFTQTDEWDFQDWTYQFLWCCHAIQWGIGRYDLAKTLPLVAAALSERTPAS
jgi:hypothetical protein